MEYTIIAKTQRGRLRQAYEDNNGNKFLDCTECGQIISIDQFNKKARGLLGKASKCKDCQKVWRESNKEQLKEYSKVWREENKEYLQAYHKVWRTENPDKHKQSGTNWRKNNIERVRKSSIRNSHNRKARISSLPNTLTVQDHTFIMSMYNNSCALTGKSDVHLDHVIPLSIGHGGTTYENMLPLSSEVNLSKHNKNIFEWARKNHKKYGFTMEKFYEVMAEVATRNKMLLGDYMDYVYECFENPREVENKN